MSDKPRPTRRKRVFRGIAWGLAGVLIVLAGGVTWLLTTTAGARFGVDLLVPRLPLEASVGGIGGRLIGPLRLDDVRVETDTFVVAVDRLELEWAPLSLLRRHAAAERLSLTGVRARFDPEALETGEEADTVAPAADTAGGAPFHVSVDDLRIEGLEFELVGVGRLTGGTVRGSGAIGDAQIELGGALDLQESGGPTARIDLTGSGWIDGAEVELDAELGPDPNLQIPAGTVHVRASGSLDDADVTLVADIQEGDGPLPAMHLELEASGSPDSAQVTLVADTEVGATPIPPSHVEVSATGGLAGYRLVATVVSTGTEELPPIDLTFEGTGDAERFDVETARADVLEGRVVFAGSVDWKDEIRWDADLEVDSLAPATLFPEPDEWPGRLSLRGSSRGRIVAGSLEGDIRVDTLGGHLRGVPIAGRITASGASGVIEVEQARLDWGTLDLDASGRVADSLDVTFELSAPDLAVVLPDLSGSVTTSGRVAGPMIAPYVQATYEVSSLRSGSISAASAHGSIDLDLAAPEGGSIDLSARDLAIDSILVDSLEVHLRGVDGGHELAVSAAGSDGELALVLAGVLSREPSLTERTWDGRLVSLDFTLPHAGSWSLEEPVALDMSADSIRLARACVSAVDRAGRICAGGNWNASVDGPGYGSGQVELIDIELARLDSLLATDDRIEGGVSGLVALQVAENGDISGDGTITIGPGVLEFRDGAATRRVEFGGPGLTLSVGPDGASASLGLELERDGGAIRSDLSADIRIPELSNLNRPLEPMAIEGSLEASMPDLAFLEALLPEFSNTKGRATLDLAFGGTLGDPSTTGTIDAVDVEADVPILGLALRGGHLSARSDTDGQLAVEGRLTSGTGTVELTGRSPLVPSATNPTTLNLRGDRFLLMNTGSIRIEVSPAIDLEITRDLVVVRGEVVVPAADIQILEVPESAVRPSNDVVFVGDTLDQVSPVRTDADIRLVLGDAVFFAGFGLRAQLAGQLQILETPGQSTRGRGEIRLQNGRYTAFGQNLEINPGQILFNGPIDNPGLALTARRTTPDGTEAGLRVSGTVKQPELVVFSTPPKSQSEALSYLLFGRPLNETSGSDQGQVGNAAAVIGGSMLATTLGQTVGLDEARIETGANPNEASLVAGKYLSPQLYVAYGIGLYDRASIFRIRYLLTPKWTVQVETGRDNGADILYRIERG